MGDESVKVAVRVRPFNGREKERNAQLIIEMQGATTKIVNPDPSVPNDKKEFTFDYSYWSHDGFVEQESDGVYVATNSKYASQRDVFSNLGQGVLDNAFAGYNCSLFAYGQTGSGKSYSMVGYGSNKGIVPITCDELFKTMSQGSEGIRYEVSFSMLEIYNEQVRDLLSKDNPKGGLPVRQNPKLGLFYVQGLKAVPVGSYAEIEKRMEQGTAHRTVASTQMNATSSRAHTVVTITFNQISKNAEGQETKKSSVMNLVDLAGSERADSTGATGDRLKEGANINKSLSALGNVISALADLSMGKKKVMVPYRDSVLTKLLQNALGGNSKTIMIAALSPADINYDETLSTLRYADRAKKIKNKAVVNENPMDKLIRELKEENDRLKKAMESGGLVQQKAGMTQDEMEKIRREMEEEIRAQLMANQEMLASSSGESWESKLQAARDENDDTEGMTSHNKRKSKEPHLINLNEDPMLSGVIVHIISKGETTIGRKDADPTIPLSGLSISKNHALIIYNDDEIVIKPLDKGSKTKVNGQPITGTQSLTHKDRVMFGSNHHYVFENPLKQDEASPDLPKNITWDFAQKEIAQAKGFNTGSGAGLSKEQQIAQEQVLEILPMVSEINAVSEELDKHKSFEVILMSGAASGAGHSQETKVMVKMKNLLNGNCWLWERGKFMNRRYMMQDLYQSFLDGDEDVKNLPNEKDPFWEPPDDVCIGTSSVFLQSLAYALDFDDQLTVTDYKGEEEGKLVVNVTPCTQNGKPLDEDFFVEEPSELLNKPYHFKISIRNADIHKARYSKGIHIAYNAVLDKKPIFEEDVKTDTVKGTLTPEFNHSKIVSFASIDESHLDFFDSGSITFRIMATQEDSVGDTRLAKMTTKELRAMEHLSRPTLTHKASTFGQDTNLSDSAQLKSEYMVLKRKYERLEQKERRLQEMCESWGSKPANEQVFDDFYRQVSALAKSSGVRLKTRVRMLSQVIQGQKAVRERSEDPESGKEDDTVSLYVFGEEEDRLAQEAQQNGGVVNFDQVAPHVASSVPHVLQAQKKAAAKNGTPAKVTNSKGVEKEGSRACVIQ